ncbi:amidohydrolase family protein [Catellatospora sp. KI3]|uniref:amidohydrolase family protein n=1 Tax=Catellatospora sp. KI3 TaxID=3041620 RepID=UPI0024823B10|nr:amidohydrolase family protein [Catellatospora sp. KI3]MDI1466210.1 amidohydrolase family protein [Catellatospora sp. KI3]
MQDTSNAKIIDSHTHVWNPSRGRYPWLTPELSPLDRAMTLAELLPDLARHGVAGVVLVQSADADFDTDLMLETAQAHRQVVGVVGWVPLDQPARAAARLARLTANPLFVGVRNLIHEQPDPQWILSAEADAGLGLLEQAGVPFDFVAARPEAMAVAVEVARRHPDLHLVLDHLGAPPLAQGGALRAEQWLRDVEALAARPRVYAKLSGLYLRREPDRAGLARLGGFIGAAVELFGPRRLMYGGDWPICLLHEPYGRTLDIVRRSLPNLDDPGWDDILSATAARVYGLDAQRLAAALR